MQASVLPQINSRYRVEAELGAGSMGAVYRAYDRLLSEAVAVKCVRLDADLLDESQAGIIDRRFALASEFRMLASMRHPHIIEVRDFGFTEDGQPFLVMQLLHEARPFTQASEDLPLPRAFEMASQALSALAYLHRRGVVHRDIKPGNVLVTPDDRVRLLDFGLAIGAEQAPEVAGALAYMAPEVINGGVTSYRSDLYAIGIMLYEMLAVRHPYNTSSISNLIADIVMGQIDWQPLVDRLQADDTVDGTALLAVIQRLCNPDPNGRYRDAYAVLDDMIPAARLEIPDTPEIRDSFTRSAPFVGRDAEFALLSENMKQAVEQKQTVFWLVSGESGVGKSRFLDALRIWGLVQGMQVIYSRPRPLDTVVYFALWREPLRHLLLTIPVSDLEASILSELVPNITELIERPVAPPPTISPANAQQRLIDTILVLLSRQQQPMAMLLDDLHSANSESLELLRAILRRLPDYPLIFIGAYRSDEAPQLATSFPHVHRMDLGRLPTEAIAHLSGVMLGEGGTQHHVVQMLHQQSEGNAFFLVEIVRTLAEEVGSLEEVAYMTLPDRVFAGGIQRVIERRLARIPDFARPLLMCAALSGRRLDLRLLTQTDHARQPSFDLERWLLVCSTASVISFENGAWEFTHDRLRESLLNFVPEDQLVALHAQLAVAIERAYPANPQFAGRLMEHYHYTGDYAQEAHYAVITASEHLRVNQFNRALSLYTRALNLYESDDVPLSLRMGLGHSYVGTGDYKSAMACFDQVLDQLDVDTPSVLRAQALTGKARVLFQLGEGQPEANYEQALRIAEAIRAQQEIADALNGLGTVASSTGRLDDAASYFEAAASKRIALEDDAAYADALNNLGIVAAKGARFDLALKYYETSLTTRRSIGDRLGEARSLNNAAAVLGQQGNITRAIEYLQQALVIQEEIGDRRGMAHAHNNMGLHSMRVDDYERATVHYERAIALFRELGQKPDEARVLTNLGNIAMYQGDTEQARVHHSRSLALRQALEDQPGVASTLNNMGRVAYLSEDYALASRYHRESLKIKETLNDRMGSAYSLYDDGFALLALGDDVGAEQSFREALRLTHELRTQPIRIHVILGFARLSAYRGSVERGAELLGLVLAQGDLHPYLQRTQAEPLRAWLELYLPPDELEDALERGAYFSLEDVTRGLLGETNADAD